MSASYVLTKTVGKLIEESLRSARLVAVEQSVQNIDYQRGLAALNEIIKNWQTDGVHLWALERVVLPLVKDQKSYILGPSGAKCGTEDTFYTTTLSAAEAPGQTELSVTSTTNMTAADKIGIELDDGTRQWTTIASTGSGTVTVDDALTGAAASGNSVYWYTTQITKPLRVENAMYAANASADEIPVEDWSRQAYMEQTSKSSSGTVVGAYYQPRETDGLLYVWQVANSVKNLLKFDILKELSVYSATSDSLAMPQEYFRALKWAVAAEIGPEYGIKADRQAVLDARSAKFLEDALDFDSGSASISFAPDFD